MVVFGIGINNCSKSTTPNTNKEYWQKKFDKNVARDIRIGKEIQRLKLCIIVVWECEVMKDPVSVLKSIIKRLKNGADRKYSIEIDRGQIMKIAEKRSSYYLDG